MFEHLLHSSHHHAITFVTFHRPTATRRRHRADHGVIRGVIFHPAWRPLPACNCPVPATAAPRRTRRRRTPLGASVRHPPRQRRPRPLGARRPPSEASAAWLEAAAALVPADRGHRRGRKRRPGSAQGHLGHGPISAPPKPHPWGASRTGSRMRIKVCPCPEKVCRI